jgi:energy-coupling factor transporter ATP-binding protein EcfA2
LDFAVERGETILILGPSGCGKSTLTLCLNGLIPHTIGGEMTGQVFIAERSTRETSVGELARQVGIVFQDPESQFCTLMVEDEVAFGLENLGLPRGRMGERIEAALAQVGLAGERPTRLDRLSGGMKQRLALACLLAMQPQILALDEPTSNLDPRGTREFFPRLEGLRQRHTILIIEHKLDALIHLVDRVLILSPQGTLLAQGEPRQVFAEEALRLEEYGIWLPQVTELAQRLGITPLPLTVDEAVQALAGRPYDSRAVMRERAAAALPRRPAIEVNDLDFTYPDGTLALQGASLTVAEGDFFALLGPNGSGKTTLANHIISILHPPPRRVRVLGRDVTEMSTYELTQAVGYVFQNPEHQFVADTVYDEMAYSLRVRGVEEEAIKEQVEPLLAEFGLMLYTKMNPFALSQGQKRRLSVATMLAVGQRILILDEPTFGQDRLTAQRLMKRLQALNAAGVTVIIITHDMRLVAEYARQVAVLLDGRVVYQGTVTDLYRDEGLLATASLAPPPLYELSRRLKGTDPTFPDLMTVDEFYQVFSNEGLHAPF